MRVKETVWIPIVGGFALGALSFVISAANITVQVSDDLILGPWEIVNTISAALFGPLGLLITELGLDVSGYLYFIRGVYPAPQDAFFMVGDFIAHSTAMFLVAFAYRFIYGRMKMPRLLGGWTVIMGIYYLVGVILQVTFFNIAVPELKASYLTYFGNVRLEFVLVTVITSLILLALPERYRRPHWYAHRQGPRPAAQVEAA
jgi:hypothetical protein